MAYRIGDYVIRGELDNTRPYATHGWLEWVGLEGLLLLELTGDCAEDLKGRHIRFEAAADPAERKDLDPPKHRLAPIQVGPTGTMTASGWVKTFDCPVEEFLRRSKLGEPPPTYWKRHLYVEWFSQNGNIVLELAGPKLEYLDGEEWKPLPAVRPAADPSEADSPPTPGLEIPPFHAEGGAGRFGCSGEDAEGTCDGACEEESPADTLQRRLDAQTEAVERAIRGEETPCEALAAAELMDHLIDRERERPIVDIFEHGQHFPNPDLLTDEQVEWVFKDVLRQLALCGIALHVCEHFTPREAYRLMLDRIFKEERVFHQLRGSGWVQGFMTSEYCAQCEEEWERQSATEDGAADGCDIPQAFGDEDQDNPSP